MRLKGLMLVSLLVLSCASALSIRVEGAQTGVSSYDNLTIDYLISLNKEEDTNYVITLFNKDHEFVILNKTESLTDVNSSVNYNMTSVASGNYAIALKVANPSITTTELAVSNVTVLQDYELEVDAPSTVYTSSEEEETTATLINKGNTDLSITTYFTNALSDITIRPQSFKLDRGTNKTLTITISRPISDYETTMVVVTIIGAEESRKEYPISIINPIINLTLGEVNIESTSNETRVNTLINNTGNMNVNATISIRTFSILNGLQTTEGNILVDSGESINYATTLPKTTVTSLTITYENNTITRELNFLNSIPFDFKLSSERLLLLGALVGVLALILYFKFKRKRRP